MIHKCGGGLGRRAVARAGELGGGEEGENCRAQREKAWVVEEREEISMTVAARPTDARSGERLRCWD